MSDLRIGRPASDARRVFRLPLEVAGEAIAVLAERGAGKTNTAAVLTEELFGAGVQVVILDPVGAWWGIRSSADGDRPGLSIPILGGQHGDVPLEETAGRLIADVAVDTRSSLLLDLSDFPSKAATRRFVADFAERLYRRKARQPSLLHLVLEEADEFAPQSKVRGDERMLGAIEQIVRRARSRGIGITMVTQRSAKLHKDVLTQADVLIAMRTTGPHDRKAVGEWVSGETRSEPTAPATIDLDALGEQIAETVEKAKANDPKELQRELAAARAEIRRAFRPRSPRSTPTPSPRPRRVVRTARRESTLSSSRASAGRPASSSTPPAKSSTRARRLPQRPSGSRGCARTGAWRPRRRRRDE